MCPIVKSLQGKSMWPEPSKQEVELWEMTLKANWGGDCVRLFRQLQNSGGRLPGSDIPNCFVENLPEKAKENRVNS